MRKTVLILLMLSILTVSACDIKESAKDNSEEISSVQEITTDIGIVYDNISPFEDISADAEIYNGALVDIFGFDAATAELIRGVYDKIDSAYDGMSKKYKAWVSARLLSEFCYDDTTVYGIVSVNKWDNAAGSVTSPGDRGKYFAEKLGYTHEQYDALDNALNMQHADYSTADFVHLQYALAARLACVLEEEGMLSPMLFSKNEYSSYLAGWLGDATVLNNKGTTSFGNDDYMADLDAENIFRIINSDVSAVDAFSKYYCIIVNEKDNRATFFLQYLGYEYIEAKVLDELGKTLGEVKDEYPNTYDFLMSVKNNKAEMVHFYD